MLDINAEYLVALTGLIGILTTFVIAWMKVRIEKAKVDQATMEMSMQRTALSFPKFLGEWEKINLELITLMKNTKVDRVAVFRAWNGYLKPRWTTAIYQLREGGQEHVNYIHFELDGDYVDMLRDIASNKDVYVTTEKLPERSALRAVYESEGVEGSYIANILTEDGPIKGTRAQTYCSFATHDPAGLDAVTRTRCAILVGRLKGIARFGDADGHSD